MSSTTVQEGPDEVFCRECGAQIEAQAEICPECGVRQAPSPAETSENYGFVFAFLDAWKRQKAIRHLLNIGLIFVSLGTYVGLLLIEALIHYRNLNSGKIEPYTGEKNQKVWVIPMKPEQYRGEEAEGQPSTDRNPPQHHDDTEQTQGTGSTEWLDEFDQSENNIRIQNQSNNSVGATVGIRTADEPTVLGSVELEPGSSEEWYEFPVADTFEVGVIMDGEKFAEQFGGGVESSYDIDIAITAGGIEFSNDAGTNETPSAKERTHRAEAERAIPESTTERSEQVGASGGSVQQSGDEETSNIGGGKILLLGLVIMFVIGPAVSIFLPLPSLVNSITWGVGALVILVGLFRAVTTRWL